MLDVKNLIKEKNYLYDYGETEYDKSLSYLEDLDFIKDKDGRAVITKKWIDFSGKVTRRFYIISSMFLSNTSRLSPMEGVS